MATTVYVKRSNHKLLGEQSLGINRVFSNYRAGGLEVNGKYTARVFHYFPKRLTEEVVMGNDESAKKVDGDVMELRERKWNKDARTFEFHKVKDKLDREFFATYKKVYDVEVIISQPTKLPVWDSMSKTEVEETFPAGTSIVLKEFPASRLKAVLEVLDLDASIQLVDGKDKAGNPAKVKPFDWEDDVKDLLERKFISFKVRGAGLDTTYTFKEGKEFDANAMMSEASLPQGEEIDVNDLPF